MSDSKVIIGTRGSKLALWQANWISSLIKEYHPGTEVELMKIKTTGDKIQDVPLAKVGGKGLFVKEIEEAMLRGEIDLAVHSMKDVPTELPDTLYISAITKREDPRDAFISTKAKSFMDLPAGATIGTSSLRRSSQLIAKRSDIKIESLRGNLDTRMRKLDEGQYDAIILAAAGVKRLGFEDRIADYIEPTDMLPAIAQGAVGLESRIGDERIEKIIAPMRHEESAICVGAERAALIRLEGGCQVPIAAHAVLKDGKLIMDGLVSDLEGKRMVRAHIEGDPKDFKTLGTALADDLLKGGAKEILREVYEQSGQ